MTGSVRRRLRRWGCIALAISGLASSATAHPLAPSLFEVREREAGRIICDDTGIAPERCVNPSEVGVVEGSIYPPTSLPAQAWVFTVVSEARVGEIVRSIEAVIDRSLPTEPRLLSWRLR